MELVNNFFDEDFPTAVERFIYEFVEQDKKTIGVSKRTFKKRLDAFMTTNISALF